MTDKKHILTYTGLRQCKDELQSLKVAKRGEIAQKIKEAREQGDLSKSAEYDVARDRQRDIELHIEKLEKLSKNAEAVIGGEIDLDRINIECKVRLLDVEYDEEMKLHIIGSTGASGLQSKVSSEPLVDRALIDEVVGDYIDVETQVEDIRHEVLEVQRAS